MQLSHGGETSPTGAPVARWSVEQVLALAPDTASRKAGTQLGAAGPWSGTGCDATGAVWGLCKGSGSTPYRTVVDTTGPAYACSCPSRKFPCKHALGLLLLRASDDAAFRPAEPADWVATWLAGRRARAAQKGGSSAAGGDGARGRPVGTDAARKRAERRAERVTGGAQELEQRLGDLLRGGLAATDRSGYGLWEETAARMVDAQAPGLAARVRELGAITRSGAGWPVRLLEECALLHLLDTAWLGRDRLPDPLAATVRTRVGLPMSAEGPPVRDHWLVLAQYDTPDGKIVTRRIWLYGQGSGRTALLLSFGAAGRSPDRALPVGATIDAELTPYPGGGQLRAELGEQFGTTAAAGPPPGIAAAAAPAVYGNALREDPWLEAWPVTLRDVIPVPSKDGWQVADAHIGAQAGAIAGAHADAQADSAADEPADGPADARAGSALPIAPAALSRPGLWKLVALSGGGPVTVFGELGHRGFDPFAAWDPGEREEGGGTTGGSLVQLV
ncbi:SWIM zinc finger family protein [Streptomyces sp. CAI-121]|uniref:SWIM zinc finger family protein n=1 Tax=unclassified Streptomyces TaxID=2593676 RepID=UPI001587534F|nr:MULTISPECIES: SWIM zinc finger family protein [unclassified Streptomyces]NUV66693.1 SWIM zinc finger family protein [Streptomyces sp. CAI-121]NUW11625.1 SWIM zinc finger family protein [Streptomyces sp. CAI-68]